MLGSSNGLKMFSIILRPLGNPNFEHIQFLLSEIEIAKIVENLVNFNVYWRLLNSKLSNFNPKSFYCFVEMFFFLAGRGGIFQYLVFFFELATLAPIVSPNECPSQNILAQDLRP